MNKMRNILTTREKEEMKKPTTEKFQKFWDTLINYGDVHTTMFFYPKIKRHGPKAVFLPEASPLLVHDYYVHGLIDTLYINGENLKEIQEFPLKVQSVIKSYNDSFAKGREIFLHMTSSYPIFDDELQLLVPSITTAQLGVSNGDYPTRDEIQRITPTMDNYIGSLAGVYMNSTRYGIEPGQIEKIRINYCSKNLLIYSHYSERISEAGQRALVTFEEQFEEFSGQLALLPEDMKKLLCTSLKNSPRHDCIYCTRTGPTSPMTE